ncbi:hypothetical protein KOR34_07430 [Posidoniimonas corsicana]|uniref:Uncharacterized protein n=1 Tax=Posidoniimonas corsicana TaxID=1938618 RepID=A0A5C5VBD2_9BACT|nr:hypothetical protein [Posidoniimonas corsicana]TWT35848.1 hypothetical protein KOR34_07430 [Posidoniimonas corsicana]
MSIYDSPPSDAPDDDEYELEAPDESVEQLARQRAAEDLRAAGESLEIDNAQRAMEERHMLDPDEGFNFQFQVKHLLVATAVLAIGMTLAKLMHGFAVLMIFITAGLFAAHWYLSWAERKRIEEASARRNEAVRRVRERQAAQAAGDATMYDEELEEADAEFEEAVEQTRFRINFSFQDLMIAVTVAAVVMGIGAATSFQVLAVILGLVAVSGLLAYGLGVQPPSKVVLVWWMTLALYVVICLLQAVGVLGSDA